MCKSKHAINVNNKPKPVDVFASVSHRGNALRQGSSWRASRGPVALLLLTLCVCGAAVWMYVTSLDSDITETLVSRSDLVSPQPRVYLVPCSEDYENYKRYPGEALLMTPACVTQVAPIVLPCHHVELRSPQKIDSSPDFHILKHLFRSYLLPVLVQLITCLLLTLSSAFASLTQTNFLSFLNEPIDL